MAVVNIQIVTLFKSGVPLLYLSYPPTTFGIEKLILSFRSRFIGAPSDTTRDKERDTIACFNLTLASTANLYLDERDH